MPAAKFKTTSPWVSAIVERLSAVRKNQWVSFSELVEIAGPSIPVKQAIKVCDLRSPAYKDAPKAKKVAQGRKMQIMLAMITLVQHKKVEQRGERGNREYRLL